MSGSDAYEDEMRSFSRLSDRVQESVLAGRTTSVGDELQELAAFCRDTRALLVQAPPESTAARQITEIAEAARRVAQGGGDSPASEGRSFDSPAQRAWRIPLSSLGTRVAVAASGFALLAAFGGAAYAGALPDPIQDRVSDIARSVGLSLPATVNDTHRGGIVNTDDGAKSSRPEPAQRTANTGAEHNRGEPQQSSSDQGVQENRGEPEQSGGDQGVQESRGEPEQSGGDQTPQADSQEHAQDKSDGPAQTSDTGQETQSNGSVPSQDEQRAGSGETGNNPDEQTSTGVESG